MADLLKFEEIQRLDRRDLLQNRHRQYVTRQTGENGMSLG
jgi:hypothetical protein